MQARNKRLEERNKMEPPKMVLHFIPTITLIPYQLPLEKCSTFILAFFVDPILNPNPNPTTQIHESTQSMKRKREDGLQTQRGATKFGRVFIERTKEVTKSINESRNESTESNKRKVLL